MGPAAEPSRTKRHRRPRLSHHVAGRTTVHPGAGRWGVAGRRPIARGHAVAGVASCKLAPPREPAQRPAPHKPHCEFRAGIPCRRPPRHGNRGVHARNGEFPDLCPHFRRRCWNAQWTATKLRCIEPCERQCAPWDTQAPGRVRCPERAGRSALAPRPPVPDRSRPRAVARPQTCAYSSTGGQAQTRLRSPHASSIRPTGGQILCSRVAADGNAARSRA